MERIVVFGAGSFGRKLVNRLLADPTGPQVLYLVDNDPAVQGQEWNGLPVRAPSALLEGGFDRVWVASTWHEEILGQLDEQLGLARSSVHVVSPDLLERADPAYLTQLLSRFGAVCRSVQVEFWLDHSSLLGLIRSGDLFALRGGVDLSVLGEQVGTLLPALHRGLPGVPVSVAHAGAGTSDLTEQVIQLSVGDKAHGVLDIRPMHLDASLGKRTWQVGPYVLAADPTHYADTETRVYGDMELPVPADPEGYLRLLYGDWRTPAEQWTFADYRNIVRRLAYDESARR